MTEFDHLVIAVRDMDAAVSEFRTLGFHVVAGGHHEKSGTFNSIIPLPCGYLELLAVDDADLARSSSHRGAVLVDYLESVGGGFVGVAVHADDITAVGSALASLPTDPPAQIQMTRRRPDGRLIWWELVIPQEVAWRRPWPFFIRWPEDLRNRAASAQPNGVDSVARLTMFAEDVEGVRTMYDSSGLPTHPCAGGFTSSLVTDRCSTAIDVIGAAEAEASGLPRRFHEGIMAVELRVVDKVGFSKVTQLIRQSGLGHAVGDVFIEVELDSLAGHVLRLRRLD